MSNKKHIILIGNPGVGKSTILNGLVGKVVFKSGFSLGKGLTQCLQLYTHTDGITYGDTPGFGDIEIREKAAKEITEALQRDGEFKLIFVVTDSSGRVRTEDVVTINLILSSINKKVDYGIIINKVSKRFINDVSNNEEAFSILFGGYNSGIHKTDFIYYFERNNDLDDMDNQVPVLSQNIITFIKDKVPSAFIKKDEVKNIVLDEFEQMRGMFEKQIQTLREDGQKREEHFQNVIKELEQKREETQKQYLEELKRRDEEQKTLYMKMEEDRKLHQQKLDEQQKNFNQQMLNSNVEQQRLLNENNQKFLQQMQNNENERRKKEEELRKQIEELRNRPPPPPPSRKKKPWWKFW